jgi:hypothetical protein
MGDGLADMAELTVDQLRERVTRYRRMAETAPKDSVIASLLRVADRYERMAKEREGVRTGRELPEPVAARTIGPAQNSRARHSHRQ